MADYRLGVVGHVDRQDRVSALYVRTGADYAHSDNGTLTCPGNHAHVLSEISARGRSNKWSVILEDDALPQCDLQAALPEILDAAPAKIVSLYLGTGYPANWQARIAKALEAGTNWIICERLLHAVGYALHPDVAAMIQPWIAARPRGPGMAPDDAISMWAAAHGEWIAYTNPSVVDHEDDGTVILVRKYQGTMVPNRKMPRKAHNPGHRLTWDDSKVMMTRMRR